MGCSIDWTTEYRTMDPDYWRRTQLSFILLYKKGYMYRGMHPVNWCPHDETAIADAEVEYVKKDGTLHYIRFPFEGTSDYACDRHSPARSLFPHASPSKSTHETSGTASTSAKP